MAQSVKCGLNKYLSLGLVTVLEGLSAERLVKRQGSRKTAPGQFFIKDFMDFAIYKYIYIWCAQHMCHIYTPIYPRCPVTYFRDTIVCPPSILPICP